MRGIIRLVIRNTRRWAELATVAGTAMLLSFAVTSPARACVGGPLLDQSDPSADTYEEVAEVIFTGTVVRRDDEYVRDIVSSADPYFWTFVVDGVEKGDVGERFTVSSPRGGSSCGVGFTLGNRYRVLAWGGDEPGRPEVLSGNGTELLEPLEDPPPVEGEFVILGDAGALPIVGLALAGLIGIGIGWWILRRRGFRHGGRYDPATESS
jgi:hypothetical protein